MKNTNTYTAIVADAKRISTAHAAAADAAGKDACVVQMHDLYENAKQCLTRDELTRIWAEAFAPKVSGIKRFAGKKYAADHPGAPAPALPKYVTDAQAERKAKAAEKATQPKAESKPKAKGKSTKAPAKAKAPTQKDVLAALLVSMNELNTTTKSLTDSVAALDARVAKLEAKKSSKKSSK